MPLASARQHPENQKENQAGHSPERAVEGQSGAPWTPADAPDFTRGLAVALGGKTPKKMGWAPRVQTAKPKTRQKRTGYAI